MKVHTSQRSNLCRVMRQLMLMLVCVGPGTSVFVAASNAQQIQRIASRLQGRVTAAESGRPLQGAKITLFRIEGDRSIQVAETSSDDSGRFGLAQLADGIYQLAALADGYLPAKLGQRLPTDPPANIELIGGVLRDNADIALLRKSAIEGYVFDGAGSPVANVAVQIARATFFAGKTRLVPAFDGNGVRLSDDLGRFRIFGLDPGDYYILALPGPFALLAGGMPMRPPVGVQAPAGARPTESGEFVPTFFPGLTEPRSAQTVHVSPGQDATNVSMNLVRAATARISGVVRDPGQPVVGAVVTLLQLHGGDVRAMIPAQTTSGPSGIFSFDRVPMGNYVLQVTSPGRGACGTGFGSSLVTVADAVVSNVLVQTKPPVSISGVIKLEGPGSVPLPGNIRLNLMPSDFLATPLIGASLPPISVNRDWTFTAAGLCGSGVIRLASPPGWLLKSVVREGVDITDRPFDGERGDEAGLVITLSSKLGALSGRVFETAGGPATNATVLVVAEDAAKWAYPSRYLFETTVSASGSFTVTNLLPESYLVIAVPSPARVDWRDPEILKTFRSFATRVIVGESESKTVDVRLRK